MSHMSSSVRSVFTRQCTVYCLSVCPQFPLNPVPVAVRRITNHQLNLSYNNVTHVVFSSQCVHKTVYSLLSVCVSPVPTKSCSRCCTTHYKPPTKPKLQQCHTCRLQFAVCSQDSVQFTVCLCVPSSH